MTRSPRSRVLQKFFLVATLSTLIGVLAACGAPITVQNPAAQVPTCLAAKPELRYWQRGTIVVSALVSPQSTATDNDLLAAVKQSLSSQTGTTLQPVQQINTRNPLPATIRIGNSATFFLQAPSNGSTACDESLISTIGTINRSASNNKPLTVGTSSVQIIGASPNWLLSATDGADHTHGSSVNPPIAIPPSQVPVNAAGKSDLTAILLDTGPIITTSGTATFAPAQPLTYSGNVTSPLLGDLLQASVLQTTSTDLSTDHISSGQIHLPYELTDSTNTPVNVKDHGTFIAGIIHQLAPTAQLRIMRVLNDYGVGDLQTILAALQLIASRNERANVLHTSAADDHIIVNMSLDLGPALSCAASVWNNWSTIQQQEQRFLDAQGKLSLQDLKPYGVDCTNKTLSTDSLKPVAVSTTDPLMNGLYLPIALTLHELQQRGIRVVASAGNGSHAAVAEPVGTTSASDRLDANMPAAFCGVIAAGGIDTQLTGQATFANFPFVHNGNNTPDCLKLDTHFSSSGTPSYTFSFANPTGPAPDLTDATATAVPRYAYAPAVNICGVLLQAPVNPSGISPTDPGLGAWSGTSFAAGIVTGAIANAVTAGITIANGSVLTGDDYAPLNSANVPQSCSRT